MSHHYNARLSPPPRGHRDDYRDPSHHRDRDREYRGRDREWDRERGDPYELDRHHHNRSRSQSRSAVPHQYDSSSRGSRGSGYYDRDAHAMDSRSRSRSPVERFVSRDVIIEGFGGDIRDEDIQSELDGLGAGNIEKVTLIKDRKSGLSRGFGFVHFATTRDSADFIDRCGPTVRIGEDRCRIAFSKERDESDRRGRRRDEEGEEWRCRVCLLVNYPRRHECFRCNTPRSEVTLTGSLTHPTPTTFTNDGERDMATAPPSQFLLFRNLEMPVNEELLAKGVLKLTTPQCPEGAAESSVRRVLLVRDRKTNESWRYGFAEFASSEEAQKALLAYQKMEKFTISSKPVTVSYIHPGVFVPVYNAPKEAEPFTFLGGVNGNVSLAYWDEEGYVSEYVLAPPAAPAKEADEKKDAAKKKAKSSTGDPTTKKRKADAAAPAGLAPAEKKKQNAAPAIPAHLQFWQNRHSELHGLPRQDSASSNNTGDPDVDVQNGTSGGGNAASAASAASANESFADLNKLACLLCVRQFKTPEKLHEHERVSALHATNLKSEETKAAARAKLAKTKPASATAAPTPEYRDRARERRQVFGNPEKQQPGSGSGGGGGAGGGAGSQGGARNSNNSNNRKQKSPPGRAEAAEEKQPDRGAALLGKMGWTAGQGLGASGEGRTEHVVAEVYTQGAGLGMHGAKIGDVETAAKEGSGGYGEFVKKTKDRAKQRFEAME